MENAFSILTILLRRFVALIVLVITIHISFLVFAEPAYVSTDTAILFEQPDFDSNQLTELLPGEKIEASVRAFGPFHRVRLNDGRIGFLADSEFLFKNSKLNRILKEKPSSMSKLGDTKNNNNNKNSEIISNQKQNNSVASIKSKEKKERPFVESKFYGIATQSVNFKEETMGMQPTANCSFYGVKILGPNLLTEGAMVTEFNFDIFPGAPSYYQKATGRSADGWIAHLDFLAQLQFAEGKNVMSFFGFGPMFRYSNINASLTSGGNVSSYSLQDMMLGMVFDLGLGIRVYKNQLRFEYKYYWEKQQYSGFGVSFLLPI